MEKSSSGHQELPASLENSSPFGKLSHKSISNTVAQKSRDGKKPDGGLRMKQANFIAPCWSTSQSLSPSPLEDQTANRC